MGAELFHEDRRKDGRRGGHDEANSRFFSILKTRLKSVLSGNFELKVWRNCNMKMEVVILTETFTPSCRTYDVITKKINVNALGVVGK